eukprot:2777212-Prymnesium_polylepis.1
MERSRTVSARSRRAPNTDRRVPVRIVWRWAWRVRGRERSGVGRPPTPAWRATMTRPGVVVAAGGRMGRSRHMDNVVWGCVGVRLLCVCAWVCVAWARR